MQDKKSVRHRGPLQELPIEHFLHPNPNSQINGPFTHNKRPLSPIRFSPTKRRILHEECISSPRKTFKTTIPVSSRSQGRFEELLCGPNSPAKKLDFGRAENITHSGNQVASPLPALNSSTVSIPTTPRSSSIPNKLAPSPEFKSTTSYFHKSSSPLDSDDREMDDNSIHHASQPYPTPAMIPREMPPLPDRQSVHYPGFDVHIDTHILLPQMRYPSSSPGNETYLEQERDRQKENVPPRKKARKVLPDSGMSSDTEEKEREFFGNMESPAPTPRKDLTVVARGGTPTPRRSAVGMGVMTSPHSTPVASKTERRERRRKMLTDEVDDDGGNRDDSVDALL